MRADLHIHSRNSDGEYSINELIEMAKNKSLNIISITDHDTYTIDIDQYTRDIQIISGLELSTYYHDEPVHILGYFKNVHDISKLNLLLNDQISSRKARAHKIITKLAEEFNIVLDPNFIDSRTTISRGTIAREIMKKYHLSMKEIFDKMIGAGCPAYFPSVKTHTAMGIKAIQDNLGLAVLAHPMLLKKVKAQDIIALGIDGIEAIYPHQRKFEEHYRNIAKQNNLFVTGGSDFHFFNDGKHGNIGDVILEGKDLEIFLGKLYER